MYFVQSFLAFVPGRVWLGHRSFDLDICHISGMLFEPSHPVPGRRFPTSSTSSEMKLTWRYNLHRFIVFVAYSVSFAARTVSMMNSSFWRSGWACHGWWIWIAPLIVVRNWQRLSITMFVLWGNVR